MALAQGRFVGFQPNGLWASSLGVALNRNSFLKAWQVGSVTFTAALVNLATISEQTTALVGATVNDQLNINNQSAPTANVGIMGGRVTVAGTIGISYVNPTAGNLTPPAAQVLLFSLLQVL